MKIDEPSNKKSNTKKLSNEKLTRRERQVMDIIFKIGEGSVNDVRDKLLEPLSYSAARSVLTRLVDKGELKFTEQGPRYVYSSAIKMATARKSALQKLKDTFFGGSSLQTMTAFLGENAEELSAEELTTLADMVAEAKKKKEAAND